MTLKQLNSFKILSECKSFTATAKELGIAQSAITTQIQELEKELGVKLFERIGKKVTLTHEGLTLLPYANQMIRLSSEISSLFSKDEEDGDMNLVIGVCDTMSQMVLPAILREYRFVYPNANIKVVSVPDITHESDNSVYSLLSNHGIDVALVMTPYVMVPDNIILHHKSRQNISLLSAYTHNLSGRANITTKDLSKSSYLLPEKNCCLRLLFEQKMLSLGIVPKLALESNSIETIKENASTGLGLCLLPDKAVGKELMTRAFERINYDFNLTAYSVVLTHRDKWISKELEAFIEVSERIIGY